MWQIPALTRRHWVVLLSSGFFFLLASTLLFSGPPSRVFQGSREGPPRPPIIEQPPLPEFYDWDTRSAFKPVRQDNVANKSLEELCSSFPQFLLRDVQPVLRTGHGVLGKRIRPQLQSISACLEHLLIFSDVNEVFEGHDIIDVIADLKLVNPTALDKHKQFEAYRDLQAAVADGQADAINDAGRKAWTMDKFKFLPSISRAWKMRPERRWYVFFEGDTYVVWDNIFRLLENFDPDVPLYFGSPSPGVNDTWFAYGGAGYVLSREAMRQAVQDDFDKSTGHWLGPQLAAKYWKHTLGDCCGDSVLGWALYNAGVTLSGLWPMFNPHAPHGVPFRDLYWCQPVISMHKPHAEDMTHLWQWQFEHRTAQRPLLYRDLALSYWNITSMETRMDWDNADFDGYPAETSEHFSGDANESVDACRRGCEAHGACYQWTYNLNTCTFVRAFRIGKQADPNKEKDTKTHQWTDEERRFQAGWDTEKIKKFAEQNPCDDVQWLTPSVKRIF